MLSVRTPIFGPFRLDVLQSRCSRWPHGHIQVTLSTLCWPIQPHPPPVPQLTFAASQPVGSPTAPGVSGTAARRCWGSLSPLDLSHERTHDTPRLLSELEDKSQWATRGHTRLTTVTPAGACPLHTAGRQERWSQGKRLPGIISTLGLQSCCSQRVK